MKKPVLARTFGERLRQLREARGWTQGELADYADVGKATVWRTERGQFAVTLDIVASLAHALGMTLPELLTFDADLSENSGVRGR